MSEGKRGPGRPPASPLALDPKDIEDLRRMARELTEDHTKLRDLLTQKRMFHVLFQDYLSTMPIAGDRGVVVNAEASKRFMDFSEPLVEALEKDDPKRKSK